MVRVVSLSDEAYMKLKDIKGDKSFSEIVIELIYDKTEKRKKSIKNFVGIWGNYKEWGKIIKELKESRKKAKTREIEL